MTIYLNIEQHGEDNPTLTVYNPSGISLNAMRVSKGIYTISSTSPIFNEGTGVFTSRADYGSDLSSGDLYGSRTDSYTVGLINWASASGFPEDELNNIKVEIKIP